MGKKEPLNSRRIKTPFTLLLLYFTLQTHSPISVISRQWENPLLSLNAPRSHPCAATWKQKRLGSSSLLRSLIHPSQERKHSPHLPSPNFLLAQVSVHPYSSNFFSPAFSPSIIHHWFQALWWNTYSCHQDEEEWKGGSGRVRNTQRVWPQFRTPPRGLGRGTYTIHYMPLIFVLLFNHLF